MKTRTKMYRKLGRFRISIFIYKIYAELLVGVDPCSQDKLGFGHGLLNVLLLLQKGG